MRNVVVGSRYHSLTVISLCEDRRTDGRLQYSCVCDCGKTVKVSKQKIGITKSCGCSSFGKKSRTIEDPVGNKYGRLLVVSRETELPRKCTCVCDCGNVVKVELRVLKTGDSKSCGCYHREKTSQVLKKRHSEYRMTVNHDPNIPMKRRETGGKLSHIVFERDSYSCVLCSQIGGELNAHHIVPWSSSPELGRELSNLVTLCRKCHYSVHKYNFKGDIDPILSIFLEGYIEIIGEYSPSIERAM